MIEIIVSGQKKEALYRRFLWFYNNPLSKAQIQIERAFQDTTI
ncbi:MAG: hypothetical protein QM536_05165 [Chitinophagaceae bacterium]|nr:hypothetical protein [Chitinophagaceae bacterium]